MVRKKEGSHDHESQGPLEEGREAQCYFRRSLVVLMVLDLSSPSLPPAFTGRLWPYMRNDEAKLGV